MRTDPRLSKCDWRIEICPTKKTYRTETGEIAVPLWIVRNGIHYADADLLMTDIESERLSAAVARILDNGQIMRQITAKVAVYKHEGIPLRFAGEV